MHPVVAVSAAVPLAQHYQIHLGGARWTGRASSKDKKPRKVRGTRTTLVQRSPGEITTCYFRGYKYTKAWASRRRVVFRCSRYRSKKCKGAMHFTVATMGYAVVRGHVCRDPEVSAPVVDARMQIEGFVDGLALTDLSLTAAAIWSRVQDQFYAEDNEQVVQGLSEQQVTGRVYRIRRQRYGGDVHGMIEIPPTSLVTGTTMPFFQFHLVTPNEDPTKPPHRIIGWAHPRLMSILRYPSVSLFIDGTFRCAPRGFAQCLVLMVHDCASGIYVPVYYILMTQRTADAYFDAMHQVLISTDQQLSPVEVICDFETALIDAIGTHFANAEVIGCLFHFKQAVQRRMKKLHIPKKEIKIAMSNRVLDMLTVIDQEKIASHGLHWVRKQIKAKCEEQSITYSKPKWRKFWAYFERTWITRFKPHLWNVHGLDKTLVARTNNPLERFNRQLNATFSVPHPSMAVFIGKICQLSQQYVDRLANVTRGRARRQEREKITLPRPLKFEEPPSDSSDDEGDDQTDNASADEDSDDQMDDDDVDTSFDYEGEPDDSASEESDKEDEGEF